MTTYLNDTMGRLVQVLTDWTPPYPGVCLYYPRQRLPSAGLRASVWQSIFTHDMRRYRRTLYSRMGDFATLITGPSGTGKELVASAIAHSRYIPFDSAKLSFADESNFFHAINIAALSP